MKLPAKYKKTPRVSIQLTRSLQMADDANRLGARSREKNCKLEYSNAQGGVMNRKKGFKANTVNVVVFDVIVWGVHKAYLQTLWVGKPSQPLEEISAVAAAFRSVVHIDGQAQAPDMPKILFT